MLPTNLKASRQARNVASWAIVLRFSICCKLSSFIFMFMFMLSHQIFSVLLKKFFCTGFIF